MKHWWNSIYLYTGRNKTILLGYTHTKVKQSFVSYSYLANLKTSLSVRNLTLFEYYWYCIENKITSFL